MFEQQSHKCSDMLYLLSDGAQLHALCCTNFGLCSSLTASRCAPANASLVGSRLRLAQCLKSKNADMQIGSCSCVVYADL